MMIIKDTMILIHLAKLSLLEKTCNYFKNAVIPELVRHEIHKGEEKGFPDTAIIIGLIKAKKITVKKVKNTALIRKANQFNIQRGEAEVIALYWQEKADLVATDDDNIRKKKILLNIEVIGTPAIILKLYKEKIIDRYKAEQCVSELKKIGWFSSTVLDTMQMEVKKWAKQ